MDLNGYFDPVGLNRPEFNLLPDEYSFSRNIAIHTPDQPIRNLDQYTVVLIGIPQDKGGFIKGSAKAPDQIRGMLYQLRKINNVRIYDLGNLKITKNIKDTYLAIRDVILELFDREIVPIIIGGSQDLSYGGILALQKMKGIRQVLTVDSRLDFQTDQGKEMHSRNYLNSIIEKDVKEHFTYSNLGHQQYFVSEKQADIVENEFMESIRLGEVKAGIQDVEPVLRDADFVSIDMGAVRHSDAPGVTIPSPNGLFGDELCAITRYAGISEKVMALGFFEVDPEKDLNNQTCHLAAQSIWYFLDGISHRVRENPLDTRAHTKKFIITLNKEEQELHFHKSSLSDRWWVEIPVTNPVTGQNYYISCSYKDYKQACNNIIPDRWWRYYHRFS
ncbi:MAG: formimidoylglutamase [Bacteroidales bacterium]|nr:formimidoylglutamase [Bacteroidales bacterium]